MRVQAEKITKELNALAVAAVVVVVETLFVSEPHSWGKSPTNLGTQTK